MNKKETKRRKKLKKKQKKKLKKKQKKELKKQRGRYFTKTKNISVTVCFLIMSIVAMIILLTMLGILET